MRRSRNQGWIAGNRFMLLGQLILCAAAVTAQSSGNDGGSPGAPASSAATGDAAKSGTACIRCHEKVVKDFAGNPHLDKQAANGVGESCAACHGPGDAHVQSGGDKTKIFDPTSATARQIDGNCLKCHAGRHSIYEGSAHGGGNVSCIRCHSIHAAHESWYLLTIAQPELCFQCHDDQRPQFSEVFRHKVKEGLILCTDCHEPHGSFGEQFQRLTSQQDLICTKCHAEMAGPFKYEHDIVKTEGCIACHSPHGGANPHMLNRARVNTICLLCHFPSQLSSKGESRIEAHDPTAKGPLCTDCHADIHGSSSSAIFLRKK